ncbi:hypothetical protein GCM10010980_20820 [Corynebacterium marinum]|nr:hypothetical protein GCM10010980_20820 [Corynebacterium marinum]
MGGFSSGFGWGYLRQSIPGGGGGEGVGKHGHAVSEQKGGTGMSPSTLGSIDNFQTQEFD